MGLVIAFGQQTTGINAVNSYSGQFFGSDDDTGLSQAQASMVCWVFRFSAVSFGLILLANFGRRTLFLLSQSIVLTGLTIAWFLDTFYEGSNLTIVGIAVVLVGF